MSQSEDCSNWWALKLSCLRDYSLRSHERVPSSARPLMTTCCRVNQSAMLAWINWTGNIVYLERWVAAKDGGFVDCDS
jgi:hypothetical protein